MDGRIVMRFSPTFGIRLGFRFSEKMGGLTLRRLKALTRTTHRQGTGKRNFLPVSPIQTRMRLIGPSVNSR